MMLFGKKRGAAAPDSNDPGKTYVSREEHMSRAVRSALAHSGRGLRAPQPKERDRAARALGSDAVVPLIAALKDDDMNVQSAAAGALESIADPRSLERVAVLLAHKDQYVRFLAKRIITGLLTISDEALRDDAERAVKCLDDPRAERQLAGLMRRTSMNLYQIIRKRVFDFHHNSAALKKLGEIWDSVFWVVMLAPIVGGILALVVWPRALMHYGSKITSICIALWTLALPFFRAYRLYHPYIDPSGRKYRRSNATWVTAVSLLFFGIFLCSMGPIGIPGLLTYVGAMICPAGFEITSDVEMRQWDLPGFVLTVSQGPVCTGKQGTHEPGKVLQILAGMTMYLFYSGMILSIAHAVRKALIGRPYFALRPYVAFFISIVLFIPVLYITLLNPEVRTLISRPVNWLIYR